MPVILIFIFCAVFLRTGSAGAIGAECKELATNINEFALDFLKLTGNEENQFFSPFGIHSIFSTLLLGARGETSTQLKRALRLPQSDEALKKKFQRFPALRSHLLSGRFNLSVASRLFGAKDAKILKAFRDDSKEFFDADFECLDFVNHSDESVKAINDWTSDQTRGRIKEVIAKEDVDPNTRLLLLNAIDFKAAWKFAFNINRTQESDFFVSENLGKKVPMMTLQNTRMRHAILENVSSTAMELPYDGETASMIVILPSGPDVRLGDVKKNLTVELLETMTFETEEVVLSMPRMKLETSYRLNDLFVRLGVEDIFVPGRSDLSGVDGTRNLYVSKSLHKAALEVNEEGTEASAATSVLVKARKALNFFFIVDRPFFFFIRDKETGLVLFFGQVVDP